jgi:hypothetical protein
VGTFRAVDRYPVDLGEIEGLLARIASQEPDAHLATRAHHEIFLHYQMQKLILTLMVIGSRTIALIYETIGIIRIKSVRFNCMS